MIKIETARQLAQACLDVAINYDTFYVLGCCGSPLSERNKNRYMDAHSFNRKASRKNVLLYCNKDDFGFDCVCLIKALLWGWSGNSDKVYGGAVYLANGVPDIGADEMIKVCKDVSTDFTSIQPGELLWCKGHVGIYVGDGLAVECTYRWNDGVQRTAVLNIGKKDGFYGRKWTKHGKLPYVTYDAVTPQIKNDYARQFSKALAGTYRICSNIGLKLRSGANTQKPILQTMPDGSSFTCYGYHTGKWLYGISASGQEGFCHSDYLKKT